MEVRTVSDKSSNSFLQGLYSSLEHIRGYVASLVLFEMMKEGVLDLVDQGAPVTAIAERKGWRADMLEATFEYLVIEDVLEKTTGGQFRLAPYGRELEKHKGWIYMMIGGYGPIFSSLSKVLQQGPEGATRDGEWVGVGSCLISLYQTIPLTRHFMQMVNPSPRLMVDFGCGNALYLRTFCETMPELRAVGIEPSRGGYEAGLRNIRDNKLEDRITLVNCDALDYQITEMPEFILFGFVLHELYAQLGEEGLVSYLRDIGAKFHGSRLIVMEVDYDIDNHEVMKSPMGRGYYNPYFLLHPFTHQKLLSTAKWYEIFARSGFHVRAFDTVSADVDPTGLGIGFLLENTKLREVGGARS